MPYFRNEKGYRKNSNRFELQEPRGTGGEFSTKIRDKNMQFQALVGANNIGNVPNRLKSCKRYYN